MRTLFLLPLLLTIALPLARAEKVDTPAASMREAATNVIVGTVEAVYIRTTRDGGWRRTDHVAAVRVRRDEKGDLAENDLAYVRYWTRAWVGPGAMPPSTTGHRGLPNEGETLRIYAVGAGYNGFGETTDGGLDVFGATGFERLSDAAGG